MGKKLFIAEKPSVAREFAKALKQNYKNCDGYMESEQTVVTWCVGHLVTMSYPEVYDIALKKWAVETLPFLPKEYKYEVIEGVKKQFEIVKGQLNRSDVDRIYICTDSGREGEYIYRLVDMMAGVAKDKERRRVWIDSQTEEEINRGIREAKSWEEYDNLAEAAGLRAKEDYLMGINFSRILSLKYSQAVKGLFSYEKPKPISVGRVMTCVLGMVVRREREIREFVKVPFYRVVALADTEGVKNGIEAEFKAVDGSKYYNNPVMYKENGFVKKENAEKLIEECSGKEAAVENVEKKKENKNAPLLFNLAELQNECSRLFKISPDKTLAVVQELYEKKLVTYPRTDARVLSTAVAKEIQKNINGLKGFTPVLEFVNEILANGSYKGLEKTRYVNDKMITDHYAIIPTGQGLSALRSVSELSGKVYELIVRRFLSIFYPAAVYRKVSLDLKIGEEHFFANFKVLEEKGYLKVANTYEKKRKNTSKADGKDDINEESDSDNPSLGDEDECEVPMEAVSKLRKGMKLNVSALNIKESETTPPKRYNSGSMILAMENAGQLIEDETLREQIKGSGIGTSATRAEILSKLQRIEYININAKTQVITPTQLGEVVNDVVSLSIKQLLVPELTASWEKGLTYVAEGQITPNEYMGKLEKFVTDKTNMVKQLNNQAMVGAIFNKVAVFYRKK